jgi:type VI secretion system protein ImpA
MCSDFVFAFVPDLPMPTPGLLDFEALIAPIPGDLPAGTAMSFAVRDRLEQCRREEDPESYSPRDPLRPAHPRLADWNEIIRLAQETLAGTSKDLLVAARLTEALLKQHGFGGFKDGLHLLRLLVEQCWDRLQPPLTEPDSLEVRAAAFYWLEEADHGACLPTSLGFAPLIEIEGKPYSLLDWRRAQEGRDPHTWEVLAKAIFLAAPHTCLATLGEINASQKELAALTTALNERLGDAAPGFGPVSKALQDCAALLEHVLGQHVAPAASSEPTSTPDALADPVLQSGWTRADAYQVLAQAAAVLQQLEPHSPVPYLIQRAVELGALPFPALMKQLIRDARVLEELNRGLGIRESPDAP